MESVNENIKAKFQKLDDDKDLSKISGGKTIYGVGIGGILPNDEFIKFLSGADKYNLDENKWILINDGINDGNYEVIGAYTSKEDMEKTANELKSNDSDLKYQKWWVLGEYGMLEYIRLQKGLPGLHH